MTPRIRLTGHIDVPIDRLEEITAALPNHIALTRAEPGCQSFSVAADPKVSGRFLVEELFTDGAHSKAIRNASRPPIGGGISAVMYRSYTIEEVS